jgi:hypothetical protein
MWEPRPPTPLWAFTACYRDSFTFLNDLYVFMYFTRISLKEESGGHSRTQKRTVTPWRVRGTLPYSKENRGATVPGRSDATTDSVLSQKSQVPSQPPLIILKYKSRPYSKSVEHYDGRPLQGEIRIKSMNVVYIEYTSIIR